MTSPPLARLKELAFFRDLDDDTTAEIARRGLWFSLAGGWELFRQEARSRTLFIVLSGRLIVVRAGEAGEEVVGYVRAGEPVGEMSLLADEPHSASVYALRDTEILALARADFDALLDARADFARALARSVLLRARRPQSSFRRAAPRVFAFVASSPSIDVEARARAVARALERYALKACWLGEERADEAYRGFEAMESGHDVVILAARIADTSWYKFVLRHADRFLVLARRDARPARPFPLSPDESSPARKFRLVDLVMIHEGLVASSPSEWAEAIEANRIFHWRGPDTVHRLARIIGGKSVGLVLSGGGARAYAHIGAVKALRERGVPIDFVSGASMGAIIAACVAMGWGEEETDARIRDAFVRSNPLGDHVLPVVALTRGARVDERLEKHFGDAMIEDLEIPFFCISSDLTKGEAHVHRRGLLRAALRASVALPGILPPVVTDGALLVDGAVVNNFPADMMAAAHRGITIGIDVAQEATIRVEDFRDPPGFLAWVWRNGFSNPPPIVSLLMRAASARQERARALQPADITVAPDVPGVELRDWKKYDVAVADGYRAAAQKLEACWAHLAPIVDAAKEA
ncbi:patatin-like phospholipase family protein [Amphiplicatus metriothermophilus]|uniref:NTE family protein n=1 Tax=Amphiplicatus metriothermophilus TaxID=1519374 RepID=A0A239PSS0_9PROT|nr:patatin-like phospholipase family protein [Amphiplicatus metriothermophilus]MBB5519140.1 NTE family protein [Amphiplicatus metriothermophilus]SNT73210.1 NTE family protein [Amphiplicatus metriothermophilus]